MVEVEAHSTAAWPSMEERLGIALPSDYRAYLDRYGSGIVDDFLWVLNPFSADDAIRFPDSSAAQLSVLRWLREQDGEMVRYPIHPEPGGVLLCAETANGDCFHWLTSDGLPDEWRLTINESGTTNWYDHAGPMSALLADLLDGTVAIPFFPHNFPLPAHTFKPS